ncbi:MAG: metalloregulator ArsR/SmtB family transcription factor [Clostridium sp.]|uniref:ArsR/SmtB family transcription factor n=1 Tax=Clostridium sp. TaxID=1506 RepID=UPI0039EB32B6
MDNKNVEFETCKCTIIHNDIINKVKPNMIDNDTSYNLAEFYKVFSDSTRIKILDALSMSEMCVCDISALLKMSQSAISHQLKVLKQSRLVKLRKEGRVVYYSLIDEHIRLILNQGLVHVKEES